MPPKTRKKVNTKKKLTHPRKPQKTDRAAKRPVRKKPVSKKKASVRRAKPKENILGIVTHYFPKVQAAVVKLKTPLTIGDTVRIKGRTTEFQQRVTSIQIDHVSVPSAVKGKEIGLQVISRVREHDQLIKLAGT